MANTDITVTLAAQFTCLDQRQQRLIALLAKARWVNGSDTAPTAAVFNAQIQSAMSLLVPIGNGIPIEAVRAAIWWKAAIANTYAASGRTTASILGETAVLSGIDDIALDATDLFLTGRLLSALT